MIYQILEATFGVKRGWWNLYVISISFSIKIEIYENFVRQILDYVLFNSKLNNHWSQKFILG